jgi:DNA-binding transcriptional ArsR family regulator
MVTEREGTSTAGWSVSRSIAVELDVVLSGVQGSLVFGALPEDVVALLRSVPADWQAELPEMVGESRHLLSILDTTASLADVILEGDYGRATLAMRELTVEAALDRLAGEAAPYGLAPDASLAPAERLVALWQGLRLALFADVGLPVRPDDPLALRRRREAQHVARILRGGDLHGRFWLWLDRFYYGVYQPWREAHTEALASLEARLVTALGARERRGEPPEMAWLPEISPLHTHPELAAAVRAGRLRVVFWIEPFGLSDLWSLQPGWMLVSFAEPGALYQGFQAYAGDVAARAKALGDPTRLIILRMIRHFGMTNTEMANALGLARPTVSVHAKVLREAGLIRSQREGREVRHEIVADEVARLFEDLRNMLDLELADKG